MRNTRTRRGALAFLVATSLLLLGDDCSVDRDAVREQLAREAAEETDAGAGSVPADACITLPQPMPVGLALAPAADRALVPNSSPPAVIPLNLATQPPSVATAGPAPVFPADSDGDGTADVPAPVLDGVVGITIAGTDVALATSNTREQVTFVDPATGGLVTVTVGGLPRSALATAEMVTPDPAALDSQDAPAAAAFTTSFTSGVAVVGLRAFVSMSNVADGAGGADPRYLPGTILVYDFDLVAGIADVPLVIFTTRFNPTDVVPYVSPGGRSFVLVTSTGAIGVTNLTQIGFATSSTPTSRPGAIEVIEIFPAADPQLVAAIPLGETAPGFGKLAIDPSGQIGTIGSLVERRVLAVDLRTLDSLPPGPLAAPVTPAVLDGSGGTENAVITSPSLTITPLGGGPDPAVCAGSVVATAWADDGRLLALEFCDGTLSSWSVDTSGSPTPPFPADRFSLRIELAAVAPLVAASAGQLQAPLDMVVRRGTPGVTFSGPDVFLLVGLPEGVVCGLASDAL